MAFFSSCGQEVYEYRLKRSSSTTSVRSRSRRPSGTPRLPSQSRVNTRTPPLPRAETPDDVSSSRHNPPTASPSPSRIAALEAREQMIQDLKASSTLLQAFPTSRSGQRGDDAGLELPQFRPGTSPSSAFSLRLKTNFDTGSVSDSGVVSRTPHTSRYLDISSPRRLHLSPLDARHPSPSSPNLSPAGYLSEGGSPERSPSLLHPSRLDVKRLLSKPAAPSIASTLSITSDSESHTIPRAQLTPSEAWPSKTRIQDHVKFSTSSPTVQRPESPERSPAQPSPPSPQQRPRNLLRKKSAVGYMRATTTPASPRRMSTPPLLQSIIRSPVAPPSRGQRSSMLQSVLGSRAAVPTSPPAHGSGKLTPAGAIAQAYKEQDMRREALAAAACAESLLPTVLPSASWLDMAEQNATPTTEEVGSAQDALCHAGDHNPGLRSSGSQPVKSLTRKVSARLRRGLATISGAGAGDADGEGEQRNTLRGDLKGGNPSNQHERQRSSSAQKAKHKPESLRLSPDQPCSLPSASGLEDSSDERSVHAMPSETALDSASFVARSKGKEKAQEKDDTNAGGRLWKLVKRISAGGLRERFYTVSTPVPPVPAIPKDLLLPPPATLEGQILIEGHFMDSNTSTSRASPSGDGHPTIAIGTPPVTMRGHDASSHPPGPSTPSSPQSSEPTSAQFFRSHTPRSSFSSIIGTSPPAPPVPVPAPARSPSPRTRSRTKSSSSSSPPGPSKDKRQGSSSPPHTRVRQRSSPDIPTFSVADVVNNFIMRRPSLVRQPKRHVPTRSLPRIVAPSAEDVGAFPQRPARSGPRNAAQQHDRVDPMLAPGSSGQSRDSHSSGGSTVCEPSASSPTISAGTSVGTAAHLTFREAGGPRGHAWTSQEKEDRWDDLLERSARAGGTLHLGAGSARLASDNIRFSTSTFESEVSIRL